MTIDGPVNSPETTLMMVPPGVKDALAKKTLNDEVVLPEVGR